MSFIASPFGDQIDKQRQAGELQEDRLRLVRSTSDKSGTLLNPLSNLNGNTPHSSNSSYHTANHASNNPLKKATTMPARIPSQRSSSFEASKSPISPIWIGNAS